MKTFSASVRVAASPDVIWAILTDATKYPEWDPGLDRIEGRIAAGEKLRVFSKLSPGRAFPLKVMRFEPARAMTWTGGMPLGLFRGERNFTLEPRPDGTTEFRLREDFTGLLLPLIGRSLPDMTAAFEVFANGLKRRAEDAMNERRPRG